MHLTTPMKRAITGAATLVMAVATSIAAAPASQAYPCDYYESNATATKFGGDYRATFNHYGETLRVEDHVTDGYAAVAYVKVYAFRRCFVGIPEFTPDPIDEDRFVMSTGVDTYNLGTPDGSGDIKEGYRVEIMVCRGYASLPGDNCSEWKSGVS